MDSTSPPCLSTFIKKENYPVDKRYPSPGEVVSGNLCDYIKRESDLGTLQQNINNFAGNDQENIQDNKSLTGLLITPEMDATSPPCLDIFIKKENYPGDKRYPNPGEVVSEDLSENIKGESGLSTFQQNINNYTRNDHGNSQDKKGLTFINTWDDGTFFNQMKIDISDKATTNYSKYVKEHKPEYEPLSCLEDSNQFTVHVSTVLPENKDDDSGKIIKAEQILNVMKFEDERVEKKIHNDEQYPLKCENGGFEQGQLKGNIKAHSRENPLKCEQCGKCFSRREKLKLHMRTHTREKPFKCERCDKCFSRQDKIKIHMRTHSGAKPYACDICGKCFSQNATLKSHKRTHTGEKPFKCERCDKCFSRQDKIKIHMRTHSGAKPYACDICGKCFSQNGALKSHKRTHTGEKPFQCEKCCKSFCDRSSLRYHMNIHNQDKPFKCEQCGDCFSREDKLKNHMATHPGTKPFDCEICGKWFSRKGILKNHMATHPGAKPFYCEICGKWFSQKGILKNHMKTHLGTTPFDCEICGKWFSRKGILKNHMKTHTREKNL